MDKTTNAIMATLFLSGVAPEDDPQRHGDDGVVSPGAIPEIRALFARVDADAEGQAGNVGYGAGHRKAYC
jgi:hypothetical protein